MDNQPILIVEDEEKIADVLNDFFRRAGYCVFRLNSSDLAAPKVKQNSPDLFLRETSPTHKDGMEVCRENRKPSQIPILIITARMEEIDRILGLVPGADDNIRKPFRSRVVVAQENTVLSKPMESKLTAGPISLDEVTYRVMVENQPLRLTPSEFALLKIMMTHPNRVFSRTELLDKALGYQHDGYDRSIDTHIKNLRKKLAGKLPGREIIQAVYGIGYRFSLQAEIS